MTRWTNWAGSVSADPQRVHVPRDVDEVAAAVRTATSAGQQLRPRGSGHSFTPIAATDAHALDMGALTGIISADTTTGVVTVRGGTPLHQLNRALDALGLAMTNLGDIDVQTIAGALATGTHGTGARFGGLATQILALELVLADGSVARCSASERPGLFAAARVGLGALGVVTAVTLQCEPSFVLAATERPEPLGQVLEGFAESAEAEDYFEFYWFPYGKDALVKRNNRMPASAVPRRPSRAKAFLDYTLTENVAFGGLCRIGRAFPALVPSLGKLSSAVLSAREYSDRSHRVFVTPRAVRFVESEFAIPRESLPEVLAELRALVPKLSTPVMFPVEVRVAGADDIWLSTAYRRDSAYVAVHQFVGMPYHEYFSAFGAIAKAAGGRPHWGKLHDLDAEALAERYPRFDDFLRVRKEFDPTGVFGNQYLDRVLGPIG